jgi:hypothetical protein
MPKPTAPVDTIGCPKCGHAIPVNEALSHQIAERAGAESNEEIAELQSLLARREEEAKARLAAEIKRAEHVAEEKAKGSLALEIQDLRNQLAEAGKARDAAQTAELEARKRARELDERARNLELEAARKIDAERSKIEERLHGEPISSIN